MPQNHPASSIPKLKTVQVRQSSEPYDAIVIGSGISGGWAAKELTEKGLRTLVLERGRVGRAETDASQRGRGQRIHRALVRR